MPSPVVPDFEVPQVVAFSIALKGALAHARETKKATSIEPALAQADFGDLFVQLRHIFPSTLAADGSPVVDEAKRVRQFSVIETAARDLFSTAIATHSIDSPEFVQVWNLFDILAALSDSEECDAALLFWLVEELLDSQTIEGCRKTFDYLESRRERITAKHWKSKQLVVLRTCNELLKRLSRAVDTAFCGRVFIFMFQSFPLGDKSSVNLRGEYHKENVTAFEQPVKPEADGDQMEVDTNDGVKEENVPKAQEKDPKGSGAKAVSFDAEGQPAPAAPDTDALYPVFWSLQEYFSQPTKLFDAQHLAKLKSGVGETMKAFDFIAQSQKISKSSDDTKDVSKKRKAPDDETSEDSNFNPKYLTSRDLFDLEISDLFFRRHILVQTLIVLDFLLSLTSTAKARHRTIQQPNKSVMYSDQVVDEETGAWAVEMRKSIEMYIKRSPDGNFLWRVIDAATGRDRGWVRWKMEGCPPMERPPVPPADFNASRDSIKQLTTSKRMRATPMGSLNLDFLKEEEEATAMEKFKEPARYQLPELATYKAKIQEDDLDLDFATTDKERARILESKASKTWRTLRIASRSRLAAFDQIEDWQDVSAVFEDPKPIDEENPEEVDTGRKPSDTRPIIISGPRGSDTSALVAMLLERQPNVFAQLVRHTNRKPEEGEIDGRDYHFVDKATFNVMLDGDQLLEFTNKDGFDYGTSKKMSDSISESGKIAVMRLEREAVQSVKDNCYDARILFVSPGAEALEDRLKKSGTIPDDQLPGIIKAAQEEIEQSKAGALYDSAIVSEDLEAAYTSLELFIYGSAAKTNGVNGSKAPADGDVVMEDATNEPAAEQPLGSNES